jgi:hypothetical protein
VSDGNTVCRNIEVWKNDCMNISLGDFFSFLVLVTHQLMYTFYFVWPFSFIFYLCLPSCILLVVLFVIFCIVCVFISCDFQ